MAELWRIQRGDSDDASDELAENWHWLEFALYDVLEYKVLVPFDFDAAVEHMVEWALAQQVWVPMEPESLRAHFDLLLRAAVGKEQE